MIRYFMKKDMQVLCQKYFRYCWAFLVVGALLFTSDVLMDRTRFVQTCIERMLGISRNTDLISIAMSLLNFTLISLISVGIFLDDFSFGFENIFLRIKKKDWLLYRWILNAILILIMKAVLYLFALLIYYVATRQNVFQMITPSIFFLDYLRTMTLSFLLIGIKISSQNRWWCLISIIAFAIVLCYTVFYLYTKYFIGIILGCLVVTLVINIVSFHKNGNYLFEKGNLL